MLASPDFLYRSIAPRDAAGGDGYELSAFELASRLSFFLWSQGPDDELLRLAAAERALPDRQCSTPKSSACSPIRAQPVLVTNFALHWLNVDDLDAVQPDKLLFPEFTEGLRQDFAEEIELFVASVLLEDQNVRTLLTADYTFFNERLARHYGVEASRRPAVSARRADRQARRHGLLGKGAVLLRTSYGDRTSPVLRGAWVLDKLWARRRRRRRPASKPISRDLKVSSRRRCARGSKQHRANPTCNACHGVIDPYGLALENFTATGSWRDYDATAGAPIDASTALPKRQTDHRPRRADGGAAARADQFVQALARS